MAKDSYKLFFESFNIKKEDLYNWGISSIILPKYDKVEEEWKKLKNRIFTNQDVYIRGYGRDAKGTKLYFNLYKEIFGNENVKKDPTNNKWPQLHMEQLTGLKRNVDILNYQVSHIWGHTKNIFLFEAPWNICFAPKIIDPLTGHEAKGDWPKEFKKMLISHAQNIYKPIIDEYNQLLVDYDIHNKIALYLEKIKPTLSPKQYKRFEKDVYSEFSPLV